MRGLRGCPGGGEKRSAHVAMLPATAASSGRSCRAGSAMQGAVCKAALQSSGAPPLQGSWAVCWLAMCQQPAPQSRRAAPSGLSGSQWRLPGSRTSLHRLGLSGCAPATGRQREHAELVARVQQRRRDSYTAALSPWRQNSPCTLKRQRCAAQRSAAPHSAAPHSAHLLPIAGWLQCLPRGACVQLKVGVSSRPVEGVVGLQRRGQAAGCGHGGACGKIALRP